MQSKKSQNTPTNSNSHVTNTKKVFYKKFKPYIPLMASIVVISCILITPHIHLYAKQVEIKRPVVVPKTSANVQPHTVQAPQTSASTPTTPTIQPAQNTTPPTTTEPTSPQSNSQTTTQSTNNSSNNTSTPQSQPDPTYLMTCVYVGGAQNGENCPYSPPPAWNGSFTKYFCTTGVNYMVACTDYYSVTQIVDEGIQYYGDPSTTGYIGYFGSCRFMSGSIGRRVYVDVNGRTSGYADCLTGTPLP